ncbi:MAG: DUF1871 family protein [Christensenellaceae bacterium]|nr:DUF1871 family protein [Christensenellaceae bacterium]
MTYREKIAGLTKIFAEWDPMMLMGCAPADEYDIEAEMLIAALHGKETDTETVIRETERIFLKMFMEECLLPEYIAEKILALIKE